MQDAGVQQVVDLGIVDPEAGGATRLCSAGRAPSGRVVTSEDEVVTPSRRAIIRVSMSKLASFISTQSPMSSFPTPPKACDRKPWAAATITADPAAPDTASVSSSTK